MDWRGRTASIYIKHWLVQHLHYLLTEGSPCRISCRMIAPEHESWGGPGRTPTVRNKVFPLFWLSQREGWTSNNGTQTPFMKIGHCNSTHHLSLKKKRHWTWLVGIPIWHCALPWMPLANEPSLPFCPTGNAFTLARCVCWFRGSDADDK